MDDGLVESLVDVIQRVHAANAAYVQAGAHTKHDVVPARRLVVVTCMDSRIDTFAALGLQLGDAHIIRSAGARVTDDVLRSLRISNGVLHTRAVLLLGHTRCGLHDPEGALETKMTAQFGPPPGGAATWGAFLTPEAAVAEDCALLTSWAGRPDDLVVAGSVIDVDTGALHEVVPPVRPNGAGP